MSGLALILAAAVGVQDIAQPVAAPRLTAVLSQPAGPSLISDVERLAADGVPGAEAMHRAFVALISGGSGPNWAGACPIWEAASTTSAEAAHFTAECVENGHDRPADLERAAELYRLAGDGGFPKSLCALGNMYMAGRGVPRDPSRAAELCLRGAEMGDADAQTDLGNFYLDGDGIAQDYAEARRWYEQAALKQQRNALFTLGVMAWNGLGGEPDLEAAGRWFEGASTPRHSSEAQPCCAPLPMPRAALWTRRCWRPQRPGSKSLWSKIPMSRGVPRPVSPWRRSAAMRP